MAFSKKRLAVLCANRPYVIGTNDCRHCVCGSRWLSAVKMAHDTCGNACLIPARPCRSFPTPFITPRICPGRRFQVRGHRASRHGWECRARSVAWRFGRRTPRLLAFTGRGCSSRNLPCPLRPINRRTYRFCSVLISLPTITPTRDSDVTRRAVISIGDKAPGYPSNNPSSLSA